MAEAPPVIVYIVIGRSQLHSISECQMFANSNDAIKHAKSNQTTKYIAKIRWLELSTLYACTR